MSCLSVDRPSFSPIHRTPLNPSTNSSFHCSSGSIPGHYPTFSPFSTSIKTFSCSLKGSVFSPPTPCSICWLSSDRSSPLLSLLPYLRRLSAASPALLAVLFRFLSNLFAVSRSPQLAAQLPELLSFCKVVTLFENRMVMQAMSSFLLNASQFCEDLQGREAAGKEIAAVSSAIVTVGCDVVSRCSDEVALERIIGAICNMLILVPFVWEWGEINV